MLLVLMASAIAKLLRLAESATPSQREVPPEWFKYPMV
jgi:hypothetical protein